MILASIPSPAQGVWHLGPIPIRAYALCIIAGIVVACWWGDRRWVARGGKPGQVLDVAVWAVPFGLVGGRLYHVMTDFSTYFGANGRGLGAVFRIWDGGLGIWGAVALGGVGAWIGCRQAGIKLGPLGDAIAPAIIVAQAIGRLGNWFNQELYGGPTTLPWGLQIFERANDVGQRGPDVLDGRSTGIVFTTVHPTFLYELLWNLLIAGLLVIIDRRFRIGHGRLFALYVAGYCLGRFFIELMRDDHATLIFGVRINVFTAALVFAGAIAYFVLAPKGRERSVLTVDPGESTGTAEFTGSAVPVSPVVPAESAGSASSASSAAAAPTVEPEDGSGERTQDEPQDESRIGEATEDEPQPQPQAEPEAGSEPDDEAEPEAGSEPVDEAEPEVGSEPVGEAEPEVGSEPVDQADAAGTADSTDAADAGETTETPSEQDEPESVSADAVNEEQTVTDGLPSERVEPKSED